VFADCEVEAVDHIGPKTIRKEIAEANIKNLKTLIHSKWRTTIGNIGEHGHECLSIS